MNKRDIDLNIQRTTKQIKALRAIADKLDRIVDEGYYVEVFFDSMTIPYGGEVAVGVGVGDLTKDKTDRILLRSNPGVWGTDKVLSELNVLVGEQPVKAKKK